MINNQDESLKEHLKEQGKIEKEKLKDMTFLGKMDYIWTYYKAHILITAIILILVISITHHLLTENQECILYSMVINSNAVQGDSNPAMYDEFLAQKGLSPKDYKIDYHSGFYISLDEYGEAKDLQIFSVVATLLMTGTVDNLMTDEDVLVMLAEIGYIMPVDQYLTKEEIRQFDEQGKVIYAIEPETKEKTAFAISLAESDKVNQSGLFSEPPVFAMIYRAPHQENSVDFLHFLEP